ncbi:hypothetical protein HKX48_003285 [Thoreauomyces humboldtii]|nr:hypothetical protein HKX48_003285 [Thoreauomyces humboldtii]
MASPPAAAILHSEQQVQTQPPSGAAVPRSATSNLMQRSHHQQPRPLSTATTVRSTATPDTFATPRETPSQTQPPKSYFPILGDADLEHLAETTPAVAESPSSSNASLNRQADTVGADPRSSGWESTSSFQPLTSGTSEADLLPSPSNLNGDPTVGAATRGRGGGGHPAHWREMKGRLERYFKINSAGAQVAFTVLLVALFTLISPLEDRFPTNTVYIVVATVVVASPNQPISIRLYTQRLIGVTVAGILSLIVLGLDALVAPRNCLDCSYKPYAVGIILFCFIYCSVSLRESIPGQAYTSKLTDLTFVITLLGAYDDLRKDPGSKRYAPPLARMASMIVGLLLCMAGSSVFWPVRVNLVNRVVTGNLLKDMAAYFHDLIHEGYLHDPTKLPVISNFTRMTAQWGGTVESIAVGGGMDVIGSEEAAAAPRLALTRSEKKRPLGAIGWVFGQSSTAPADPERGGPDLMVDELAVASGTARPTTWEQILEHTLEGSHLPGDDEDDPVKSFHEKTHPAAVHILRTLEKERARLEASYQVEVRWTQQPHFIPIAPLNQVIRRLRLLFYQLSGLYSDRLITLRALSPRFLDSAALADDSSCSPWVKLWVQDAVSLMHLMHSSASSSSTDPAAFSLERYTASLCNALISLGDIVLWTTSQGHRIIGTAELAAKLKVTVEEVLARRTVLETELLRIRGEILAATLDNPPNDLLMDHPPPVPPAPAAAAASSSGSRATGRVFGATMGKTPPVTPLPRTFGIEDEDDDDYGHNPAGPATTRAILAFQYSSFVKLWEITEVVLSTARAVGKLIKVYT